MFRPACVSQVASVACETPAWLQLEDLKELLQQELNALEHIESIRCRSEHSALHVQIQAKLAGNATRSFNKLVKSRQLCEASNLKLPRAQSFQLEQHMFHVVLPALEELYGNVGERIAFAPSCHKSRKQSNCLYLEDLQAKGFRQVNQQSGLQPVAMQVAISKLAAYHAASARYLQLQPEQLAQLSKLGPKRQPTEDLKNWLQRQFHESLRANDLQHYEDKVKCFQQLMMANQAEAGDPKSCFNVILTGGCWASNLLGQFDAFGQLKDVAFLDFGSAVHGPAVRDLLELLLTAPAAKSEQFDANLRFYQNELAAKLSQLQFKGKVPSLTDIQLDLLNHGRWAFEVITGILPIVLADLDCANADDIFKLTKYSVEIKKLLPWLENRGYLEAD